jgi:hypothetical protein
MNLAAMLLITALIFAEKALPAGERTARFAATALIGYGGEACSFRSRIATGSRLFRRCRDAHPPPCCDRARPR